MFPFEWSERKYSLPELHDSIVEFPLLVKVAQGHYSKSESDTYYPEQIFLLYNWGAQERVLGRNKAGISISIPLNHEHKFFLCGKNEYNNPKDAMPLKKLTKLFQPPLLATFDPNETTVFYVDSVVHSSDNFGQIAFTSAHHLEFIRCSPVILGRVAQSFIALPITLSMAFVIAKEKSGVNNSLMNFLTKFKDEASYLKRCNMDTMLVGITGYFDVFPEMKDDYQSIAYSNPELWWWSNDRSQPDSRMDQTTSHEHQETNISKSKLPNSRPLPAIPGTGPHLLSSNLVPYQPSDTYQNLLAITSLQPSAANVISPLSKDNNPHTSAPPVPPRVNQPSKQGILPPAYENLNKEWGRQERPPQIATNPYLEQVQPILDGRPQQQLTKRAPRLPQEKVQPIPDGTRELMNKLERGLGLASHPQPPCGNPPSKRGMVPAYENTYIGHLVGDRQQWSSETAPNSSLEQAQPMSDRKQCFVKREVRSPGLVIPSPLHRLDSDDLLQQIQSQKAKLKTKGRVPDQPPDINPCNENIVPSVSSDMSLKSQSTKPTPADSYFENFPEQKSQPSSTRQVSSSTRNQPTLANAKQQLEDERPHNSSPTLPPQFNHPLTQNRVPAYENMYKSYTEGRTQQGPTKRPPTSPLEQIMSLPASTQEAIYREVQSPGLDTSSSEAGETIDNLKIGHHSTSINDLPLSCEPQFPQEEQEASQPRSCPSTPDEKQSPPLNLVGTAAHGQTNPGSDPLPTQSEELIAKADAEKVPANIRCWEDVPDKVEEMSVSDVCDCLHLMGLGRHAEIFAMQQVDGRLLAACSAADFQEGFGLTHFSALKLEMLAKQGWKPNLTKESYS